MDRAIGGLRPIDDEDPLFGDDEVVGMLAQRVIQSSEALVVCLLKHQGALCEAIVCGGLPDLRVIPLEDVLELLELWQDKHRVVRLNGMLLGQGVVVSEGLLR